MAPAAEIVAELPTQIKVAVDATVTIGLGLTVILTVLVFVHPLIFAAVTV